MLYPAELRALGKRIIVSIRPRPRPFRSGRLSTASTALTVSPCRRCRPFRSTSSISKATPATSPPSCLTRSTVARGGAAGGEQIVDDQHPLPWLDRIAVHLQAVAAVLEVVAWRGWSPTAASRPCGPARSRRQCRSATAAPRMKPRLSMPTTSAMPAFVIGARQRVDRQLEAFGVAQQRRDVVEQDAGLGKIRDVPDLGFECVHRASVRDSGSTGQAVRRARHSRMRNPVARPDGATLSTVMSSIRAPAGPRRSFASARSTASMSPSNSTSTRPSPRFRTQPCSPSTAAALSREDPEPDPLHAPADQISPRDPHWEQKIMNRVGSSGKPRL